MPIDCELGQTCYIEDYVDNIPGSGQADFTCGLKSRDGHRGTDIVLRSFALQQRGVNVLAAAPGTVATTRDGMNDTPVTDETRASIRGRECGNAVRIDHGDGWQTLYCHMARGSVMVHSGQSVARGSVLGQVGLSGLTNVPHVHISVLHNGKAVDPFNPSPGTTCGTQSGKGLWQIQLPYTPTGLFTAGFSTSVPEFDTVKSGAARVTQTSTDQSLVLYAHAFYPQNGDVLTFMATGPQGEVFRKSIPLKNPRRQIMRAFGRRSPAGGWPEGAYRGYVELERAGRLIAVRHADIYIKR